MNHNDSKVLTELDPSLKLLDPTEPVKYDFSFLKKFIINKSIIM